MSHTHDAGRGHAGNGPKRRLAGLLLLLVTVLAVLTCLPEVAHAATSPITDEQGRQYPSFDAALAAVADNGSVTLTVGRSDASSDALSLRVERPITVTVRRGSGDASAISAISMTGGTLVLESGPVVRGVVSLEHASLTARSTTFEGLIRVGDQSELVLDSCNVRDPEVLRQRRADQLSTICLTGSSAASVDRCSIEGDVSVGHGSRLRRLDGTKLLNDSTKRKTALCVEAGGQVTQIVGSTVFSAGSALLYKSAGTTSIERSTIVSGAGNRIAATPDDSDWKGCRIEKGIEGSERGVGFGAYHGSDREFDITWAKGVVPEGFRLSRWTKLVELPSGRYACRYLVRTDCSLTYDANGGTGDMGASNRRNQWGDRKQTVAKCGFTRAGTTFKGWNTKADGTGTSYKPGDRLSFEWQRNVVLYAQWGVSKRTLSFDSQGGTPVASQTVDDGSCFTRPEDPTKAVGSRAYEFAGWFRDKACTQAYDFATPAGEDALTVYAKWVPATCTLVFDSMGGSHVDGVSVRYGEAARSPGVPTRPHYRFKGWFEDERCTRAYDFATKLTEESRTVYAKWGDYFECHEWDEGVVTRAPTCTSRGLRTRTCAADPGHAHTTTEPIAALGHAFTAGFEPYHWLPYEADRDTYYKEPTCDKPGRGLLARYCTRCGTIRESVWTSVAALGHVWGSWEKSDDGSKESRVCTRDPGHVEERPVLTEPCTHASLTHVPSKPSTCTEQGNAEYWSCPDCHEWFLDAACETVVTDTGQVLLPLAEHVKGDLVRDNEVAPTCVADGSYDEVTRCTSCGEEVWRDTVVVPATGAHVPEDPEAANHVPASCERAGTHDEVVCCAVCGQVLSWRTVQDAPALGHVPGDPVTQNVEPAGCEEDGGHDEAVSCTRCGELLSWTWVLDDATGHDWGAWQTVEEPTEHDEGLARRVCAHDEGHVEFRALPTLLHEHSMARVGEEPATCASVGHAEYWHCSGCGEWFVDEEGTTPIESERDVVLPRLAHSPGEAVRENVVAPTCEDDGHHDECAYCTGCGRLVTRRTVVDESTGHDWGDWETVREATESSSGLVRRTCRRDSAHVEELVTPALHEHALEYAEAVAPTCWSEGMRAHWRCSHEGCGARFRDAAGEQAVPDSELVIPRIAHSPSEKVVEDQRESTCWERGARHEVVYCDACGEELSRDVVPLPLSAHEPGDPVRQNEVAPTCSSRGAHDEVVCCAACGEELSRRSVSDPCTEHTPSEVDVTNVIAPTQTEPGSHDEVVHCLSCFQILSWETIVDPPTGVGYYAAEGDGGSWAKGSEDQLVFVFKRTADDDKTFSLFRDVTVDGEPVADEGYLAEAGSVVIRLQPDFLEGLDVGEHALEALFEDGVAEASFVVVEAADPKPQPEPEPTPEPKPETREVPKPNAVSQPQVGSRQTVTAQPAAARSESLPGTWDATSPLAGVGAHALIACASVACSMGALLRRRTRE